MTETASPENQAPVAASSDRMIYWHRDLPPFRAEPMGEHVVEASSARVSSTFAYRDELWTKCYEDGMGNAEARLRQEVARLGGKYAHILTESVDSKHDAATGEAWLHVCLTYMLYR